MGFLRQSVIFSRRVLVSPKYRNMRKRWLCSQTNNFLQTTQADSSGIAIVRMHRPPANGLSLEFLTELTIQLEKLEDDRSCRGMVLMSSLPGIFSAGIDMEELILRDSHATERLTTFWRTLQTFVIRLHQTHLVTMAAITGHAPAGGCLLSLACDYRIMAAGRYTIGISALRAGLSPPPWIQLLLADTIGKRQAELSILQGKLYSPDEALRLGLVDKVVPAAEVLPAAEEMLLKWLQVPDAARILTKANIRKKLLQAFEHSSETEVEEIIKFVQTDSFQQQLKSFMENLKNKDR